jgi:hypothetical protein
MVFLVAAITMAATEFSAYGQSRMTQPSSGMTPQQMNGIGSLPRSSFLTAGFGANPLAALGAYGGAGALSTLYGNPIASTFLGANSYGGGYGANPYSSGYGGASYSGYYLDPGAEEIKAQGQIMVNQQQAYYIREKVRAERIANRHKAFDESLYESEKASTIEQGRHLMQTQQMQRARNNPPVSEIWSGQALNDLVKDLERQTGNRDWAHLGIQLLPLVQDGFKHINVTRGTGNIALLRDGGRIHWPEGLSGSQYQYERDQLGIMAHEAIKQAVFNSSIPVEITRRMSSTVDGLRRKMRNEANTLSSSHYIEAKGFLSSIDSAITALHQEDVSNHFNGTYELKANTIPELVRFMTEQRLQFAPALPAGRTAYAALHQALTTYHQSAPVQTTAR